jgi:hypothetical protein
MYRIDSMYEAMADAAIKACQANIVDRWVASAAFWLARQQIYNETEFWLALGAKVFSELEKPEQDALAEQFSKAEDAAVANVGDWPEITQNIQTIVDRWAPVAAEEDLDALRAAAVVKVDRSAEAFRLQFITAGVGQSMAYQQKLEEARAKVANGSIADSEIPHIVVEAQATGMSKGDKAVEIIETFRGWQQVSAGIEGKRMAAKMAIAGAETAEAINTATDVNWAA